MIQVMENVNAYVLGKVPDLGSNINEDFFTADALPETICRHDPAPLISRRYMNGAYWAEFNFSYYTKDDDPISARQVQEAIVEALSLDNFSELLGLHEGRLEVTARPTPVSREDDGAVVYTSSFRLVYFQEV